MSCCGVKIEEPRNADLRRTYTPGKGFSFSNFTARMQVRVSEGAPGAPLLNISMLATANGSVFTVSGSSLVMTIYRQDLESLPVATPISDPAYFVYDIILTDESGFENKFIRGQFVMIEGVVR